MIVTVTPNPALDATYTVPALVPHETHRVSAVTERAGGKGVNVASVLAGLGMPVLATGFAGGETGRRLCDDLDERGVPNRFVAVRAETRRTVTVVGRDDGDATVFNEPGRRLEPTEWQSLLDLLAQTLSAPEITVLVASGSLPPGAPCGAFAQLTELGHRASCQVVVDTSGEALVEALTACPDVVKPNRRELIEATGRPDAVTGAEALLRRGAREVVVSLGADGLLLVRPDAQHVRAWLEPPVQGNPTGAGDAAVAAIAAGLADGSSWSAILADAAAWSAAAVVQPAAGWVDNADITRLRATVHHSATGGS